MGNHRVTGVGLVIDNHFPVAAMSVQERLANDAKLTQG